MVNSTLKFSALLQEELKKTLEDAKARLSNMSSPEAAPIQRRKSRKSET